MKHIRKINLVLLIAVFAVSLLLFGIFLMPKAEAVAEDQTSQLELAIKVKNGNELVDPEKDEAGNILLVPGQTVNLIATFSSTFKDKYWYSINTYVGPLSADASVKVYDENISKYLSADVSKVECNLTQSDTDEAAYTKVMADCFKNSSRYYGLFIGLGVVGENLTSTATDCVFNIELAISEDITVGTEFKFGALNLSKNSVSYSLTGDGVDDITDTGAQIAVNTLPVKIRKVSDDATLKELKLEHGNSSAETSKTFNNAADTDAEHKISANSGDMKYSSDSKDLNDFKVTPTANDSYVKKIEVSLKDFSASDIAETDIYTVESGKSVENLTLQAGPNTLYIRVTAEDDTQLTYDVAISMAYVRLISILSTAATVTEGVTKNGLSEDFDSDTFTYETVYVPNDFTTLTLSAAVLSGYAASEDIAVSATNWTVPDESKTLKSEQSIVIQNSDVNQENPFSVTFTATASDAVSTKAYTLNFVFVDVNTDADIKVKVGEDVLSNDESSAATAGADFYYVLSGTDGTPSIIITADNKKTVKVYLKADTEGAGDTEITCTAVEGENSITYTVTADKGTYKITVTAEAGNERTYTLILAKALYLKLAGDATCDFITEYEFSDDGELLYYRRTYEYLGWEHGVDDAELETVVLGQIMPDMTVNAFLKNIDSTQLNQVILYNARGEEIYNCGNVGADVEDASYLDDPEEYSIGTGWYIVFNEDTVYISVLGDINGDGRLGTQDSSNINSYLMERPNMLTRFDSVLVRLAAYVINSGAISTRDSSIINSILMERAQLERYLAMPEKTEEE